MGPRGQETKVVPQKVEREEEWREEEGKEGKKEGKKEGGRHIKSKEPSHLSLVLLNPRISKEELLAIVIGWIQVLGGEVERKFYEYSKKLFKRKNILY